MNQFSAYRARRIDAILTLPVALLLAVSAEAAAPKITGTPVTSMTVGQSYSFKPAATDADRNTLTFSIANRPAWASFSATTGQLTGTPFAEHARVWSGIVISVSDGKNKVSLPAYSLTVKPNANKSPTITGAPVTKATVGASWSFQPTAKDPEGKTLKFTIRNKPSWATFNTATGKLSGTPTAAGTTSSIMIIVTDGVTSASLQPAFSVTAAAATVVNSAPTISGTPVKTAKVGSPYTFTPAAVDANRDNLTFSVDNKPSWATFNTATGQLTGTPTAATTFSNIVIRVSDGKATAALPAFAIVVAPVSTGLPGSVTVSWMPPTTNVDGTVVTALAGYRVRYGKSPNALTSSVTVSNAGVVNSLIEGLTPGVWYFTVTAFTSEGAESDDSTVVSANIT
jgi:Putative Ig domain